MRSTILACIAVAAAAGTGCNTRSPVAYGDNNSIIVVAPDSLWAAVGDTMHTVMEPLTFTVRNERTFELTHVSPADPTWGKLREWKQVLVIGQADDPWVAPAVPAEAAASTLPAILEKDDVWARGQRVTALVLPEEGMAETVVELLPRLHEFFDERFRRDVVRRMFVSGADTLLRDSLRETAGFELLLPNVYTSGRLGAAYRFINANPNRGALDRSILVTWREGAAPLTADELVAWRDSLGAGVYEWGQEVDREALRTRPLEGYGDGSIEVQGVWLGTDPTFPMAGPFLSRAVVCPAQGRTYLLDAFLYAPSRDKYEYVLQLETILDSFACGS
ncbi:MAG TPA: DUF4837 family protein [Longimicrobiales bacterium]